MVFMDCLLSVFIGTLLILIFMMFYAVSALCFEFLMDKQLKNRMHDNNNQEHCCLDNNGYSSHHALFLPVVHAAKEKQVEIWPSFLPGIQQCIHHKKSGL